MPSEATGGQLTAFRATLREGFSPPRHLHTREDEVFLVVEGDVCFEIDGRRLSAGPGTSVYMPRGVPHGLPAQSAAASLLGVMVPGDFEHLFGTLSRPATARTLRPPGTPPLEVEAVIAEQLALGTQVVGPPMRA